MTPPPPFVSVIVPCRNERAHIDACLESICRQQDVSRGMEILIADGMSDDGTRDVIRRRAALDPRIRMLDNPKRITPTALNTAIRAARGEIVIRMDAHTRYAPNYVRSCVDVLCETGADNVGGPARTEAAGYIQRAVAAAHHSRFSTGGARFHDPNYEGEVDTVFYGCWRRSTLLAIGLFDEELVRNQDDELNFRLKRADGRLWQSPSIRCWYSPRASLAALFRQQRQYGYWKVRVIQKHGRPASIRHLVPVLFTWGLIVGALAGLLHPLLWIPYLGALAAYAKLNAVFSISTAAKSGWDLLPVLPAVFFIYHVGYGIGFTQGLVRFTFIKTQAVAAPSATPATPHRDTAAAA